MTDIYHPTIFCEKKYLRRIYSLYLQGKSTEDIRLFMHMTHNLQFSENDINHIITDLNDALL